MNILELDAIIEPTIWQGGFGTVLILIAVVGILAVAVWSIVRTIRKTKTRKEPGAEISANEEKK